MLSLGQRCYVKHTTRSDRQRREHRTSSSTIDGSALVLTCDAALDTGSIPAAWAFMVKVDTAFVALAFGSPVTVASHPERQVIR